MRTPCWCMTPTRRWCTCKMKSYRSPLRQPSACLPWPLSQPAAVALRADTPGQTVSKISKQFVSPSCCSSTSSSFWVRPTRYAHCGESPRGAAMMRNPRPEEQLRGGNEPWKRKFEGKSRLYEQKLHIRPDGWTRLQQVPKSDTSSRIHKVDADGAGGK